MAKEQDSKPDVPGKEKTYQIIIDGRPREWHEKEISYRQVILLYDSNAVFDGNVEYTVTYTKGHEIKPKGSLLTIRKLM